MESEDTVLVKVKKLSNLLDRFMNGLKAEIEERYPEARNISAIQGRILLYIFNESKKRIVLQKDIETLLDIRRSTVAIILRRMEANGLIIREASESDVRMKTLRLTERALEMHPKVHTEVNRAEKQMIKGLTKAELEVLNRVLDKIAKNIS